MASTRLQSTFAQLYKDDFRDSDNYHRILFNSGRALQARELTQMQTIIQREIERFGRNIFKEGAPVLPGGITLNTLYEFVKLTAAPSDAAALIGTTLTGATSGLRARVVEYVAAEGSDPHTIYVQYIGGTSISVGITERRFSPGETLSGVETLTVQTVNTTANPAVGQGFRASIGEGAWFVNGHFVYAVPQSIILSKYTKEYTGVVGFVVTEDIVTASDTVALYDNSGALPNQTSPGADRYRITLTFARQEDVAANATFLFQAKIDGTKILDQVTGIEEYNFIQKMIETRTREESGDYIVSPFTVKFDVNDSDTSNIDVDISPGTAYVSGVRSNFESRTKFIVPKPTTTSTQENDVVAANYGNYVKVSSIKGLPNTNEFEEWNLRDSASYLGSTIGTARIRSVERAGLGYIYSLFDIEMTGSNNFRNVKSLGLNTNTYANIELVNGRAEREDVGNQDLFFQLPRSRVSTMNDINLTVQKYFTATTDSAGEFTLTSTGISANEFYDDPALWTIVVQDSADVSLTASINLDSAGGLTNRVARVNTGAGNANKPAEVLAYVGVRDLTATGLPSNNIRQKTLTTTTVSTTLTTAGGQTYLNLGQADIYDILSVRRGGPSGENIRSLFTFDNGQRDTHYENGRLILNRNFSAPSGNIYCEFRYFSHGTGGYFFSKNSYDGQIPFSDIPSYTNASGQVIQLRDVLDFRSTKSPSADNFTTSGKDVFFLPRRTSTISLDNTYFLPRRDKIIVSTSGEVAGKGYSLSYLQGTPAFNPILPPTPDNSLELFNVYYNANTIDEKDLVVTPIETKRYTMKDIGRLEKRINTLEELTTLSLLELDTANLTVFDSNDVPRTKAGFLVDNFKDNAFAQLSSPDYRAAVDPSRKVLTPLVSYDNIRLIYDSAASSNVVRKGDNVYLQYSEVDWIDQPLASRTANVNPFTVVVNHGTLTLSPASDDWIETQYEPAVTVDGGNNITLSGNVNNLANLVTWDWAGVRAGDVFNRNIGTGSAPQRAFNSIFQNAGVARIDDGLSLNVTVNSASVTTRVIDDRLISSVTIPFMRSRKVYFKAEGLKPYQQHFAFFDDRLVSDFVREEDFKYISQDSDVYGNQYNNATAHPEGSSTLISDENGVIEGSFFVPSTETNRFRTGDRELKLLNISVNEDFESTSYASAIFTAAGNLETRQETISTTRNLVATIRHQWVHDHGNDGGGGDPLAQSFYVEEPRGVFLTKVRLYFASKDPSLPVHIQIRPMVEGFPSASTILPGSIVYKYPSEITTGPFTTNDLLLAGGTDFVFPEPVFLQGGEDYALVVEADNSSYLVYIAQQDDFILGSTERRITKQPSTGTLFLSQNSKTYEPSQNQDLTFKMWRAEFSTSAGTVVFNNAAPALDLLETDPFYFDSGSSRVRVFHQNHGLNINDIVRFTGLDSATTYGGIRGTSIMDSDRIVREIDWTGYTFDADSAATGATRSGGSNVRATTNVQFNQMTPLFKYLKPTTTSVDISGKFTTGKSFAGLETRFQKDAVFGNYENMEPFVFDAPRLVANRRLEESPNGLGAGGRSVTMSLNATTTDPYVSPVIDLQRASLITMQNVIDRQDSSSTVGFNIPITFVGETEARDGTSASKHITKPVTLFNTAVGLKFIIAANRPSAADFQVYYRTAGDNQVLEDQDWVLVPPEFSVPTDENTDVFREYRYLAGGASGNLDPFNQYQVKIVMRSTNSSKIPTIRDLRVIALGI